MSTIHPPPSPSPLRFTLRYLLLLIFWWGAALALVRNILSPYGPLDEKFLCYTFLPLALGPAYGGLVLRMRFGFFAGVAIFVLMWLRLFGGGL
jgi:hypothetical protein